MISGCRHAPQPLATVEGRSAFRFVEAPDTSTAGTTAAMAEGPRQPVDVLVTAEPIDPLAIPVFPATALGKLSVPALVGVRITIDARGRVSDVGSSLRALSTPGPFADAFREAVEVALAQWRFTPAEKRHMVPGRGGPLQEDYWVITSAEKTETALDVAFTFTTTGDVQPRVR